MTRPRGKHRTRGAVLAEFVIAVVPLLMMTFGWLQLAWLYTANLLVKHAANACVRAAVVSDDKPWNPGKHGSADDIQTATSRAANVEKHGNTFTSIQCSVTNESSEKDVYGKVTATVTAEYACAVPMGKVIVCGADAKKTIVKSASLPFQGAHYKAN